MCATYSINTELNGIEISFDKKPTVDVLDSLKANGYRWHRVKKLWYARQTETRLELAKQITEGKETEQTATEEKPKANKFGVQVGDLFVSEWGYEQTNITFLQVVELIGETSVRVREVFPEMTEEKAVSGLSADRKYKNTRELLPAKESSVFIKDQVKGDIKRLKSYRQDGTEPQFRLDSFANAYLYHGETCYESWYY
jgi:hypothetical protein